MVNNIQKDKKLTIKELRKLSSTLNNLNILMVK